MKWGRAARGDRVGVPVERQEKEEKTGRSAKYEATCEPKGGEGKGYENPEQDHRKCCEPKEMTWGGEGVQEWEGRERQPNVQRAQEDGHCASEEEQGQERKPWAKRIPPSLFQPLPWFPLSPIMQRLKFRLSNASDRISFASLPRRF